MRKCLLILTLTAIMLQACVGWVVYIGFAINRDYIAKNLCVQKDIKNNHCQGACHLRKQLQATLSDSPSQLPEALKSPLMPWFWENLNPSAQAQAGLAQADKQKHFPKDHSKEDQPFVHRIFHPPLHT